MTPFIESNRPLDITGTLSGERLFLTGATGFLGKVLVEKLLWSVPDVGRLVLLVRAADDGEASERLRREVFASPIMARLRARHFDGGGGFDRWVGGKIEAVAGDLARDRLGLDTGRYADLCRRIDRVVGAAASVRFDERLDRALELNTRGALRTLELARDAGDVPLLHVSTCFVSGRRRGLVGEEVDPPSRWGSGGPDATLRELAQACRRLRRDDRRGGGPRPAADASTPRSTAAGDAWVAAGAEQAAQRGFHDVYTLTKALAEALIERRRGSVPVAILRPAIVSSAAAEPIAGWIEGVKVTDPLLVAYGRGLTRDLPGRPDTVLEVVPVDFVANALLAALADLRPGVRRLEVAQIGSRRNPLRLGELMEWARQGFGRTPLRGDDGEPIRVGRARWVAPDRFRRALLARRDRVAEGGPRRRVLDHLVRLVDVYRPYLGLGASFDDRATVGLWERLSAVERAAYPFEVSGIDWRRHVAEVHVPGLVRFALRAESGAPAGTARPPDDGGLGAARGRAERARSTFELFRATAGAAPEAMALQTCRDGRWLRYTYEQALEATRTIAWRLAERYGVGHGDRVALWASGGPEWVLTMLALHRLGAVSVPLDPQWPVAEVAEAVRFVDAKLVCAAPALAGRLARSDRPVVELAAPFVPEPEVGRLAASAARDARVGPEDLATLVFTSGTTVAPRAVPLTHGNLLANVRDLVPLMELSRERLLSVLPIHHVFELMVGLLVPMAGASTVSYVAEIKPAEISWMMSTTRPTVLVAVPRLLELLHGGILQSVAAGGPWLGRLFRVLFALSRLTGGRFGHLLFAKVHRRFGGSLRRIATGGSALAPSLGRSFELMGFRVAEGYGMTETSPVLTVNPWRALRFGSVGRPLPGVEVEIRPRARAGAGAGENGAGEIWVRGGNVMSGYYADPEATSAALRDGWLATGDLGYFDRDGYLHVCGRTKDVIVTAAGKNVYPEEVEARYRDLSGVEELVVLGLPSNGASRGERVAAVVVPRDGVGEDEIRAAIAERSAEVPSYQRITGVEIWRGEVPKTTTLKVRRERLRQAVLAGGGGRSPRVAPPAAADAPPTEAPCAERRWVIDTLARLTNTRPGLVDAGGRLDDLGVDSLTRMELVGRLEERYGMRLTDEELAAVDMVDDLVARARAATAVSR